MITVHVTYFGALKERRGLGRERRETSARSPAELYAELAMAYPLSLDAAHVRFAVDDAFVDAQAPLTDGAHVALMPPVAGG
ncbi:MAG: MoaD/ThiS family protein [Opitutales bacterium]